MEKSFQINAETYVDLISNFRKTGFLTYQDFYTLLIDYILLDDIFLENIEVEKARLVQRAINSKRDQLNYS